ncbi:MAG TPA: hypothetical protein VMV68_10705 [Spirochaetia bacterium]|nr:hypothetical protein [Spirochaetia bacterium]
MHRPLDIFEEGAILLRFLLQGSALKDGKVVLVFKPPFDIVHGLPANARGEDPKGTKKTGRLV